MSNVGNCVLTVGGHALLPSFLYSFLSFFSSPFFPFQQILAIHLKMILKSCSFFLSFLSAGITSHCHPAYIIHIIESIHQAFPVGHSLLVYPSWMPHVFDSSKLSQKRNWGSEVQLAQNPQLKLMLALTQKSEGHLRIMQTRLGVGLPAFSSSLWFHCYALTQASSKAPGWSHLPQD